MDANLVASTEAVPRAAHPPGLYLLSVVEMWERFSFYGMRALLVLFLADGARGGLEWTPAAASRLMGFYGFTVYALPLIGGYIADRFWGTHKAMVVGALIIAAGHFSMALPSIPTFFIGMALVAVGTGFFKVNASTMIGQLYDQGDPRRDGGFTIFYLAISAGALVGPIACGYLGESSRWGWHYAFGLAGLGMLCGLTIYLLLRRQFLAGIGDPPRRTRERAGAVRFTKQERERLMALFVIMFFTIPFWIAFEQAASSMNFFAQQRTDRAVGAFTIPASWFQSVNPAVLIVTAPLFAKIWTALGVRRREPSAAAKMIAALFLLGIGFVFMVAGAHASDGGALVSPWWLLAAYSFLTFGELCLSPTALSLVTKLSPAKVAAGAMGLLFFSTAISDLLAGQLAAITEKVARGDLFRLFGGQADFYFIFVVMAVVVGLGLLACKPWLRRHMHGLD